jgi:hypothetical protein
MKDSILGIPFYRFYYDKEKIPTIFNELLKLPVRPNGGEPPNNANWIWDGVTPDGTGSNLHEHPAFADIFAWIQECLDEVASDMGMTCKLKINSAWAHLNHKGDHFYQHTHANTFLSSNYYASGHPEDKTVWLLPNPYFHTTNIYPCGTDTLPGQEHKYFLTHEEPTEPGKYIVFPSTIVHYAQPNTSNMDRVTIACDAFPCGLISQGYTSKLRVQVF